MSFIHIFDKQRKSRFLDVNYHKQEHFFKYLQDITGISDNSIAKFPEADFAFAKTGEVYLKSIFLKQNIKEIILPASKILNSESEILEHMNQHISETFERVSSETKVHVIIDR